MLWVNAVSSVISLIILAIASPPLSFYKQSPLASREIRSSVRFRNAAFGNAPLADTPANALSKIYGKE